MLPWVLINNLKLFQNRAIIKQNLLAHCDVKNILIANLIMKHSKIFLERKMINGNFLE